MKIRNFWEKRKPGPITAKGRTSVTASKQTKTGADATAENDAEESDDLDEEDVDEDDVDEDDLDEDDIEEDEDDIEEDEEPKKIEASSRRVKRRKPSKSVLAYRNKEASETRRVADIRDLCDGKHSKIEASAIINGWTVARTGKMITRKRPKLPTRSTRVRTPSKTVLQAACRIAGGDDREMIEKAYNEQVLEQADTLARNGFGFKPLIEACCILDGRDRPSLSSSQKTWIEAGFSTTTLPDLLGSTARRSMEDVYNSYEGVAHLICKKLSTKDFKETTGIDLSGSFKLERVGDNGDLPHANMKQATFKYSVDTFGKQFGVTRQMMHNDDLNAFLEIPRFIGMGAAIAREELFWKFFFTCLESGFISAENGNLHEGADGLLSYNAISVMAARMKKLKDPSGNRVKVRPADLLVPTELEASAHEFTTSEKVQISSNSKQTNTNIHRGKFGVIGSPELSDTEFDAAATSTGWGILAGRNIAPAFGFAYLNGAESPIIEQDQPKPGILGVTYIGYTDIGVCAINPLGIQWNTGVAAPAPE